MGRDENLEIFNDTVNFCKTSKSLQDSIQKNISEQKIILEKDTVQDGSKIKRFETPAKIVISK